MQQFYIFRFLYVIYFIKKSCKSFFTHQNSINFFTKPYITPFVIFQRQCVMWCFLKTDQWLFHSCGVAVSLLIDLWRENIPLTIIKPSYRLLLLFLISPSLLFVSETIYLRINLLLYFINKTSGVIICHSERLVQKC